MSGIGVLMLGAGGGAGAAVTITMNAASIYAYNTPGGTATAIYQLTNAGAANQITNGTTSLLYNWCVPSSQATNYECYATLTYGSLSGLSSALDTWLPLSSNQSWRTVSNSGVFDAIINVGIRRAGTSTIIASADIYLNADVS